MHPAYILPPEQGFYLAGQVRPGHRAGVQRGKYLYFEHQITMPGLATGATYFVTERIA
jgi:hypothetical protein